MMSADRVQVADSLSALLAGVASLPASMDRAVNSLTFDSREVAPGSVFFARRGTRFDATRFAPEAARAGACAMIEPGQGAAGVDGLGLLRVPVASVEEAAGVAAHRFYRQPSEALPVIAVTGTNGKTSVCHFVAAALELLGLGPVGVLGTLGSGIGTRLRSTGLTTPDCIAVHAAVAGFRDDGARAAVMEASSHALDQHRLAGLRVDSAVFTNLSRDHLDYHGDMASYARSKARLFALPGLRAALINASDVHAGTMCEAFGGTRLTTFSLDPECDCDLPSTVLSSSARGVVIEVRERDRRHIIASALLGAPAAWNLLAAFAVLRERGIDGADAARALSQVGPAPGRMQTLGGDGQPLVVVDYAHTPAALAGATEALSTLCEGALWCVFGAGGERDPGKRPLMGQAAARFAQRLVITDDNPRGEDGQDIVDDILRGIPDTARNVTRIERDRGRAIAEAVAAADVNDIVLVAGKGHEAYQDEAGERRPFSDVAAVRAALQERGS